MKDKNKIDREKEIKKAKLERSGSSIRTHRKKARRRDLIAMLIQFVIFIVLISSLLFFLTKDSFSSSFNGLIGLITGTSDPSDGSENGDKIDETIDKEAEEIRIINTEADKAIKESKKIGRAHV